jgi:hypothetical protein
MNRQDAKKRISQGNSEAVRKRSRAEGAQEVLTASLSPCESSLKYVGLGVLAVQFICGELLIHDIG